MKKIIIAIILLSLFFAFGCSAETTKETEIQYVKDTSMPEPFGNISEGGGDELAPYYSMCSEKISGISTTFMDLVDSDECNAWIDSWENEYLYREYVPTDISQLCCLPTFIEHFDIPYDTVKKILMDYNNFCIENEVTERIMTDQEIEAISSRQVAGNPEFYSDYSILIGEKAYTPEFVYTHSPETLEAVGITAEQLLGLTDLYEQIPFLPKAITALENKIVSIAIEEMERGELSADEVNFEYPKFATLEIPEKLKSAFSKALEKDSSMPEPFGNISEGGGDELEAYYSMCSRKISGISTAFMELVDIDEFISWTASLEQKIEYGEEIQTDISQLPCLPTFIERFDIPYDTVKSILLNENDCYRQLNVPERMMTDQEIEAISSRQVAGNPEFYSDYSILIGEKAYTPEFVYTHSPETLEAVGITAEQLLGLTDLYEQIPFLPEAITALENKIVSIAIEEMESGELSTDEVNFEYPKFATLEIPEKIKGFFDGIFDIFGSSEAETTPAETTSSADESAAETAVSESVAESTSEAETTPAETTSSTDESAAETAVSESAAESTSEVETAPAETTSYTDESAAETAVSELTVG